MESMLLESSPIMSIYQWRLKVKCPVENCNGKVWTEPTLVVGRVGRCGYSDNLAQYGLDVCCDKGHRIQLTGDDYKRYIRRKRERSRNDKSVLREEKSRSTDKELQR